MNEQTKNYQQIENVVANHNYEQIPELISQFLDNKDKHSLKELLIQLLFQEDVDDICQDYKHYPSTFIKSLLREGWTGYDNLSYSQIIREFIARESLLNYPLYIEIDEAETLLTALIDESDNSEIEDSNEAKECDPTLIQYVLVGVQSGVIDTVQLFDCESAAQIALKRLQDDYHPEADELQVFPVSLSTSPVTSQLKL